MTHHNVTTDKVNPLESTDNLAKVAKEAGNIDVKDAIDYREAEQGVNVQAGKTGVTAKSKRKGESKSTKKALAARTASKTNFEEEARCGSCANPMTQSSKMNWEQLEVFLPPKFKAPAGSPTGASGRAAAVQCDDCKRGIPVKRDYMTVPGILIENGKIYNIPIADLVATREKEK